MRNLTLLSRSEAVGSWDILRRKSPSQQAEAGRLSSISGGFEAT